MKKLLLLASAVAMLGATAPVSAHADGVGYTGTCRIATVNDTTEGGVLGGQRVWNGEVNIVVVASTPGDTITSAGCYIKVNPTGTESKILDATVAGPLGVGAGRATFTADATDTVFICTHVTTAQTGAHDDCVPLTTTPICPEQVCGDGGLLDQIIAIINTVNDLTKVLDPAVCGVLKSLAATVNSLPTSGVLYIDPATGDTYVGGTTPADLFWDCPPYVPAA